VLDVPRGLQRGAAGSEMMMKRHIPQLNVREIFRGYHDARAIEDSVMRILFGYPKISQHEQTQLLLCVQLAYLMRLDSQLNSTYYMIDERLKRLDQFARDIRAALRKK